MSETIRPYVVTEVTTARPETPLAKVAATFSEQHIRHMPVLGPTDAGGWRVLGVVSTNDLLQECLGSRYAPQRPVSEVMSRRVETISLDETPAAAAARMLDLGVNCLIVVDGDGHFRGLMTTRDLLRALAKRG